MENTEKKELVIIPEKEIELNQESITETWNELILIFKFVLLVALIMLVLSLAIGIFKSI